MATKSDLIVEATQGRGCLGRADLDEPLFILRGQDMFAPAVILTWASMVEASLPANGTGPTVEATRKKIAAARADAHAMQAWQIQNGSKRPD